MQYQFAESDSLQKEVQREGLRLRPLNLSYFSGVL